MEEPDGIIALIEQLRALHTESKGLPKDQAKIPKGIVPSPEGSTFTKSTLSPILSPTERSRVKQFAEIFKSVVFPDPEARKAAVNSTQSTTAGTSESKPAKLQIGVDEKSENALGVLGSILGIGSGLSGAAGIAASALPILAGVAGAAAAIYVAGPTSKLFAEALVILSGADWDGLERAAVIGKDFAYIGMDFIKMLQSLGMDTIERFFNIGRLNLSAIADSLGVIGINMQHFKNVEWEDMGKATVAMTGLFGLLLASGTPIIAIFQTIGAMVLKLGASSITDVGRSFTELSIGADNLFRVLDMYKDLPLTTLASGLGSIIAVVGTVGAAGIAAPLVAIGALAADLAGMALQDVSDGITALGNSLPPLASGLKSFEEVDSEKLIYTSVGIKSLAGALLTFSVGNFASNVINSFSSIFGSDGFGKFLTLADKADKLASATTSVIGLKDAFKEFAMIRTDHLAYNLKEIVDAVDSLNIDKLKKIYQTPGGVMSDTMAYEMKTIREYLLFGGKGNKYGLLGMHKDLLDVNTDQLKTLKEMRTVLLEIRSKIPTHMPSSSTVNAIPPTPQSKVNNFRDELRGLTIQPNYR